MTELNQLNPRNTAEKSFNQAKSIGISPTVKGLLCLTVAASIWGLSSAWAAGYVLESINFNPQTNAISIKSQGNVKGTVNSVNVGSKKRIIFDIENAEIGNNLPKDSELLKQLSRNIPSLQSITVNQFGGSTPVVRILLDVDNKNNQVQLLQTYGNQLDLRILPPTYVTQQQAPQPVTQQAPQPYQPQPRAQATSSNENYLKGEIARLQQANQSLQGELARLTQSQQGVTQLQAQNQSMAQELNTLRAQVNTPQVNPETQRQLKMLQSKYAELADENSRLRGELSKATSVQPLSEGEFNLVKKQLSDAKQALSESITTINGQNREIAVLKRELADIEKGFSSSKQEELTRLNTKVSAAEAALQTRNEEVNTLKAQIERLESEKAALSKPVRIQPEVVTDTATVERLETELSRKNNEITQLQREVQALKNSTPEVVTLNNNPAPGEIERLKAELDNVNRQYKLLVMEHNRDKAEHDAELARAKDQYEQAVKNVNQFNNTPAPTGITKEELASKEAEIKTLTTKIASLEKTIEEKASTSSEEKALTKKIAALEKDLEKEVAKAEKKTAEVETLNSEVATLKTEVATLKKSDTTDDAKVMMLEKENEKLKADLSTAKEETEKVAVASASYQTEIEALKKEVTEAKAAAVKASEPAVDETELTNLKKENEALTLKMVAMKKEADEFRSLPNKVTELEKDLDKAENTIEKLKASAKKRSRGKTSDDEAESLKKQIDYINEQLIAAQKKNEDYASAMARLEEELKNRELVQVPDSAQPARVISSETAQKAENHYKLGTDLANDNQVNLASQEFQRALEMDPDNIKYVYALSSSLAQEDKTEEAIKVLEHFVTSHPNEYIAYNQMGKIYLSTEDYPRAKQAFARGIPINTLSNFASSLKKMNMYEDSENAYKLAVTLSPNDSEVLFNLGNLYNTVNELNKAEVIYRRALEAKPDFPEAHYNLGLVYSKMDDRKNAVKHLEKFLELSPSNQKAEAIRSYVSKLKK